MLCSRFLSKQIFRQNKILKQNILFASQQAAAVAPNESPSKETLPTPSPDNQAKPASPKLESIVASISQLNLLEVADLAQLLKKRLNIPDVVMPMGGLVQAAPSAEEEEEVAATAVQTKFTVKLMKFNPEQKIVLLNKLKATFSGMNLIQAKSFVDRAPVVIKEEISKEEAEKLKEDFEKLGATCEIS